MKKVVILSGPSGCGKSTWAAKEYPDAFVCSVDHHFIDPESGEYKYDSWQSRSQAPIAHSNCLSKLLSLLLDSSSGRPIVIDNTNIHVWERQSYIQAARLAGWDVELHVWECLTVADIKLCAERTTHEVPISVIARMAYEHQYYPGIAMEVPRLHLHRICTTG